VVEQPIATAIETLQGLRLRPQQFDSASGVSGETGFVLRQEPVAGSAIPGDSVVRLWVGIASSSSLWLIILGSLAGLVAAAATVKTVRQRLRDKEWRRRLTFEKHSVPGAPRIPASANPLARPEMQLVPRPGAVQSSVVGDGPLIKGDSK